MKGAAEFCLDYLVENEQGLLVTSPSTSPENRFGLTDGGTPYAVAVGSTSDILMIRGLFGDTIEAATVLGMDAEFREKLKATTAKLPPYKVGANGERTHSAGRLRDRSRSQRPGQISRTERHRSYGRRGGGGRSRGPRSGRGPVRFGSPGGGPLGRCRKLGSGVPRHWRGTNGKASVST
ncbi:MAG TPA: hypothetical protein VF624_10540 [Tepidisphaeraceae bacterium]|jgi:hypothetical protein